MPSTPTTTADDIKRMIEEGIRKKIQENKGSAAPAEPEEPIKIEKKERKVLKNQKMFSEVFGVTIKPELDFPVTVFKPADWDENIRPFIPKVDPTYHVQVDEARVMVEALEEGDKIMISGPTGSGKSSLVKHVCAKLGRPFIRLNMNGDVESSAIFGHIVVEDGATIWKDGPATDAIRLGAVLLIDEWEIMPPDIGMGFQNVLEDNGYLFLKEKPGPVESKMITPHAQNRLIYAGNTVGQGDENGSFAGVQVQNTATIDRFTTTIYLGYLDKEHETNVLKNTVPELDKSVIKRMLQFADFIREANQQGRMTLTMSPRTLISWGRKIVRYGSPKDALTYCFLNKLNTSNKKLALDLYGKVFGK